MKLLCAGNTVLITGLTGAWDPENRFWALSSKFPLENLLGLLCGTFAFRKLMVRFCSREPSLTLPSHLWVGEVRNYSAEIIGTQDGWITAVRKKAGGGEAEIWIPSLVDVGAWLGDNAPLGQLLKEVTAPFLDQIPFRFEEQSKDCLMRVLRNGDSYVTVIANGAKRPAELQLKRPAKLSPRVLWGEGSEISKGDRVSLAPRGTLRPGLGVTSRLTPTLRIPSRRILTSFRVSESLFHSIDLIFPCSWIPVTMRLSS